MSLLRFDLEVTYEDGSSDKVTTDQRDLAEFELQEFALPIGEAIQTRTHITFRWLAWHALKRSKRTDDSWEDWSNKAVQVSPIEVDELPNPGNSGA